MNTICLDDDEIVLTVGGGERKVTLRIPDRLCERPALLIHLAIDRANSLDGEDYRWVPDIFLAAGHRVAAFDLPYHGERADETGDGLVGIAAAMASGLDVFADIRETGRALIDHAVRDGLVQSGVVLNGISRGGLSALHVTAGDSRVLACAAHAPVTRLSTLTEFRDLTGTDLVNTSDAFALVDRLADRPVFLAMGESDPRVSAEYCFQFYAALVAAASAPAGELFSGPGTSHGPGFLFTCGYQAAAAFLLKHCAHAGKLQG